MEELPQPIDSPKKTNSSREIFISALAIIITLGLCFLLIYYWHEIMQVRRWGYAGLFIIGIFTGATALIPIPGILLVFTLGRILVPPLVGVCSGLGEAIGSTLIYLTGWGGKNALRKINAPLADKFEHWLKHRGNLTVLIMSSVLNPFFLPFTIVAGIVHFGLWKFFLLCFIGKTIKNTIIAYLGYLGLGFILKWIGVPI